MNQESNVGNIGDDNNDVPLLKVKEKKVRAPLTDKQKEGLSKGRETRDKNAAIRKATRVLQAETLLGVTKQPTLNPPLEKVESNHPIISKIRTPNPPLEKVESNTDFSCNIKRNCVESESEEEEIIYKKKPKSLPVPVEVKKPKKKRTVIVYEESSDDEESKEIEEDYHFPPRELKSQQNFPPRELKSQQNRKSQIQQHNERQVTKNFFCS